MILTRCSMAESTMSLSRRRRRRLRDLPINPCCALPLERRTRPVPVTLKRLEAALLVFIFGMGIRLREATAFRAFAKPACGRTAKGAGGRTYERTLVARQAFAVGCFVFPSASIPFHPPSADEPGRSGARRPLTRRAKIVLLFPEG